MLEDWILRKKEIEDSKNSLQGADLCNATLMQAKLKGATLVAFLVVGMPITILRIFKKLLIFS